MKFYLQRDIRSLHKTPTVVDLELAGESCFEAHGCLLFLAGSPRSHTFQSFEADQPIFEVKPGRQSANKKL